MLFPFTRKASLTSRHGGSFFLWYSTGAAGQIAVRLRFELREHPRPRTKMGYQARQRIHKEVRTQVKFGSCLNYLSVFDIDYVSILSDRIRVSMGDRGIPQISKLTLRAILRLPNCAHRVCNSVLDILRDLPILVYLPKLVPCSFVNVQFMYRQQDYPRRKASLPRIGVSESVYLHRLYVPLSNQEKQTQIEHRRRRLKSIFSCSPGFKGNGFQGGSQHSLAFSFSPLKLWSEESPRDSPCKSRYFAANEPLGISLDKFFALLKQFAFWADHMLVLTMLTRGPG